MKINSELPDHRYLRRVGGRSAILAALCFLTVTIYIFVILRMIGFNPNMFDDHTRLHPWVVEQTKMYKLSWIFYFLTQLFLIPLPQVLVNYFKNGSEEQKGLAQLSNTFGTAGITLAVLCPVIFYATSSTTAQAYVSASGSLQNQGLLLVISTLMTDIPKEIRLFSEVFLSIWLIITGYLFLNSGRSKRVGWLTLVIGCWAFFVVTVKIFNPANPLEDSLGLPLALSYLVMGLHLLKAR